MKKQPKSTIVYDLRSSRVVAEEIIKHGGTPRRERVGHAFMKKALRDSHGVFGGELSGHFYYRDNFCADSGLITFVHMLNIVSQSEFDGQRAYQAAAQIFRQRRDKFSNRGQKGQDG